MATKKIIPLPMNSKVGHYRIRRVLGGGGFSVVYLAEDLKSRREVVIKEYFPAKLAQRDKQYKVIALPGKTEPLFKMGRKLFFQEASIIAAIQHPNIVQVVDFCQANGTIYIAMEYEQGLSLQSYLKRHRGNMPEEQIRAIFVPLLDALQAIHQEGLLHLDIKPGNIFLRENKGPMLLDFGAVHKVLRSAPPRMFPVVTHGFSPPEQSKRDAQLGPWSDLYALGASVLTCITGKPPVSAKERAKGEELPPAQSQFEGEYSAALLKAIDWCLQMEADKRPAHASLVMQCLQNDSPGQRLA